MENELFKLVTRRFIAWSVIVVATLGALFLIVYGAVKGQLALATMGGTALFTEMGAVTAFYFSKKINEE